MQSYQTTNSSIPHMALKLPNPLNSSTKIKPPPTKRNRPPSLTITSSSSLSSPNGSATMGRGTLRVAYQGSAGAYSEYAARLLSPSCTPVPCPSVFAAVAAVESSIANCAIMPVESTLEGSLRNYGLLLQHDLVIVQEINLFVNYCLLAMPGVPRTQLRKVISHPMALAHCGRMLERLGLDWEPVDDTAGAVEMLRSQQLLDTAAIASPRAATIYGLDVIAHGIQDENWNVTRFLLLSKSRQDIIKPTTVGPVKTSMVVAHRGGSMMVVLKVLSTFSKRNINLSKMEVKNPAMDGEGKGPVMIMDGNEILRAFSHVLYVDFEGSIDDDDNVKEAIEEIKGFSVFVRILGCYAVDTNVYDLH